jgi:hypothetical protein
MIASKIANPTSASLTNVSLIKAVRANGPKLSVSKAIVRKSANRATVQNAANGHSALIAKIAANALSRATRTNRAATH